MQILVLGAGAVGSFLGARLGLSGHKVVLVGRPALAGAVAAAGGLALIEPDGARRAVPGVVAATSVAAALAGYGPCDLALLTVKAYDTATAAAELAAAGVAGPVLTLQNGIGNEETLAAVFSPAAVLSGAIDTPVTMPAAGVVQVHRPRYEIGLAPMARNDGPVARGDTPSGRAGGPAVPRSVAAGDRVAVVAAALRGAGFGVAIYPDYRGLKWTKLLMNILANAACAILDWTPAQVMADSGASRLEARAWQEALAVLAALAVRPVALGGYPLPYFLPLARRLPPAVLGRVLAGFVAGGRGSKSPSLQLALPAARPSEVAWLNGAVARCGAEAGIPTPVNAAYTRLVTALTAGQVSRDAYRGRPARLAAEIA